VHRKLLAIAIRQYDDWDIRSLRLQCGESTKTLAVGRRQV